MNPCRGRSINHDVKPLIIQFTPPEAQPTAKRASKSYFVPVNLPWSAFSSQVLPLVSSQDYDSVLVHTRDDVNRDMKGVVGNMMIKTNAMCSAATRQGKPVLTYESSQKPFYFMNPSIDDMKAAGVYAPSDGTIMKNKTVMRVMMHGRRIRVIYGIG